MKKYPRFLVLFVFLMAVPVLAGWMPRLDPDQFLKPVEAKSQAPKVEYTCVSTGEFNLKPDKTLHFETWCVERAPTPGQGVGVVKVADIVAPPQTRGSLAMYRIPFEKSTVKVKMVASKPVVRLYYYDDKGALRNRLLAPRTGKAGKSYRYDFSDLVNSDIVLPKGEIRRLEP